MISLDLLSGFVSLGFLVAVHRQSLPWLHWITLLRSILESIYYPITTSLVPLLVEGGGGGITVSKTSHDSNARHHPSELQLATTLNTFVWATMAMVRGILVGSVSASMGGNACYGKVLVPIYIHTHIDWRSLHCGK
jgi:hypothetical protein